MGSSLEKLTTLDDKVQLKILDQLKIGMYLSRACLAAGITYRGFCQWRVRWEQGDPEATRFDQFFRAVERASAIGESKAIFEVRSGGQGWQANAWFLERRFPQRWGKKDRTPVPPKPRKPLGEMTDDELDQYERDLEKKGRD